MVKLIKASKRRAENLRGSINIVSQVKGYYSPNQKKKEENKST